MESPKTINVAWITIIIFIYTAPRPAVNRCIRKPERTCGIDYITQTLTTATLSAHIAQMQHGIEHTSGLRRSGSCMTRASGQVDAPCTHTHGTRKRNMSLAQKRAATRLTNVSHKTYLTGLKSLTRL